MKYCLGVRAELITYYWINSMQKNNGRFHPLSNKLSQSAKKTTKFEIRHLTLVSNIKLATLSGKIEQKEPTHKSKD